MAMMISPKIVALRTSCDALVRELEPLFAGEHPPEPALLLGEAPDAVLDDDHRAVDDEAEVDRAEAHQVAADLALDHAGDGDQHRERDRERGDERGADVAEQQEQDDDDQRSALRAGSSARCSSVASTR